MSEDTVLIHATCMALGEYGILIIGPSGSGKSDLALQLIDGAGRGVGSNLLIGRLVSDDQTLITRQADRLVGTSPRSIAGKLEVRGVGIVDVPFQVETFLDLAVTLRPSSEIERMPQEPPASFELCGIALPEIAIDAACASAPARLRAALSHLVRR